MKKIFVLLLLVFTIVSYQLKAQLNCNASFSSQFLNTTTVKFNSTDTFLYTGLQHTWIFGDGAPNSSATSPTHTYSINGSFVVKHIVKPYSNTNTAYCTDTVLHTIVIAQETCNLKANYYSTQHTSSPLIHSYLNASYGFTMGDSIRWTFGDGTFSYDVNPEHTFANAGVYNVCLRIKKQLVGSTTPCISEYCKLDTVRFNCNIKAYFSNSSVSASTPSTIQFTNQSVDVVATDSISWTFGDGTTSMLSNPNHIYTSPGTYNVCLKVKRISSNAGLAPCVSIYCKNIVINPPEPTCNLIANFTSFRDSLNTVPYTYHFNNTSTNLVSTDSIRWTFGDGTSSSQINANHAYAHPGIYDVCLRIIKRNTGGTSSICVAEKCYTITVSSLCNITPTFNWSASIFNHKEISFRNPTFSPEINTTASWNFGDGTTSTMWNPVHNYSQAGIYFVCLKIQSSNCVRYKCDTVRVVEPIPSCSQISLYSFTRSFTNSNIVTFTPAYPATNVQYTWTFGDGTGAQTTTATHQFANAGNYTVCLTAYRNGSCATTTCTSIPISSNNYCNNVLLNFNDVRDPLVPNRITFMANANTSDQVWTITKIPTTASTGTSTIHSNNPTYVFLDSGYYRVCLRGIFAGGCVKEFCKTIHVAQAMPFTTSCTLQVYPNPANNYANANITLAQPQILYAYIYNNMNMLVAQKQQQGFVGTNVMSINIGSLPSGIYTYRLVHGKDVCSANFIK